MRNSLFILATLLTIQAHAEINNKIFQSPFFSVSIPKGWNVKTETNYALSITDREPGQPEDQGISIRSRSGLTRTLEEQKKISQDNPQTKSRFETRAGRRWLRNDSVTEPGTQKFKTWDAFYSDGKSLYILFASAAIANATAFEDEVNFVLDHIQFNSKVASKENVEQDIKKTTQPTQVENPEFSLTIPTGWRARQKIETDGFMASPQDLEKATRICSFKYVTGKESFESMKARYSGPIMSQTHVSTSIVEWNNQKWFIRESMQEKENLHLWTGFTMNKDRHYNFFVRAPSNDKSYWDEAQTLLKSVSFK